ncbi:MAG TPA: hypothetical protein VFW09_17130 [Solirubrobacteraceae bacterium]|nr:hypothetical protein [Solirubrobacteraceae bacterium]
MSDTTLEPQRTSGDGGDPRSAPREPAPATSQPFVLRHVWWFVGIALIIFSGIVAKVAQTRPGYDPYGWLIWGYQSIHGSLSLAGAPSWKPLPLIVTAPAALFGTHLQLWIWMTVSLAVSFSGTIFAGRIAFKIVNRDGKGGWALTPAILAALFAGFGMYGIQDNINGQLDAYLHYLLSFQSDTMIVSLMLAAIDFHMQGRRRWAMAMLLLGGLGRPEDWPILILYSGWCWCYRRDLRTYIVGVWALLVFLWFGVPGITNGRPFVSYQLAQESPRAIVGGKVGGTLIRFKVLNLWPVWVLALTALGWSLIWAVPRLARERVGELVPRPGRWLPHADERLLALLRSDYALIIGIAFCTILWVAVEAVFALMGTPAVPRYMFEPAVASVLLAGIGLGWLVRELPSRVHIPWPVGAVVGAALLAALIPGLHHRAAFEHKDLVSQKARTHQFNELAGFIHALGGYKAVRYCGSPVTDVEHVSLLGWLTRLNDGNVGHQPQKELHMRHTPIVLFTALPNGWAAWPWHTRRSRLAYCQRMKGVWTYPNNSTGGTFSVNRVPPKPDPPIPDTPTPG